MEVCSRATKMAEQKKERDVLSDIIDLYRNFPCLWDLSSNSYKDISQKKTAWKTLVRTYKEYDADANEATVKKKIDNLKTSYQREAKKVKESKNRTVSAASNIYRPNLWYFQLMTFLDKKYEANKPIVDPLMIEDVDEPEIGRTKRKKLTGTDTKTESNPFGVYVGKKMEEIPSSQQRDLAEKLISEIIFLAKTDNLTFDTKIEIPSRTRHYSLHSPPSTQISQSPHSSSDNSSSYQNIHIQSPHPSHTHHDSQSSLTHPPQSHTLHSPELSSPSSHTESPAGDILKEMLTLKK